MKKLMKAKRSYSLSKKKGIGLFCLAAFLIGLIIVLHENPLANAQSELTKKIVICVVLLAACAAFTLLYDKLTVLPVELYQNRRLIWKLSKNDFKKRYAGSYLGALWAMAQPVVTVVMYWIVFDKVFQTRSQMVASGVDVPYVLYLTAGLVPWFYFSEALPQGTTALLEYSYLVKKVVFKISILPIIKIIAATFIHAFFVGVLIIVAICYGYMPTVYTLQIVYYSFCLFVLVLGISYSTCAIVVFFRDLQQIINIALQIGMWATPILWDLNMLTPFMQVLFKLNPLVYIVNGYRTSIYGQEWFWADFFSMMYFWIFTVVVFGIGALIFKRLKVHFADIM
ncbi:MAG: ABC transporter permease [Lachnospiraceae bacterium]|nr:ABC transporter permease [Lachnospiraceae bacterium]